MSRSRYRESRTLVRRLCRLPGEDRAAYAAKVARLRKHFEQFNLDVAEICQWLFGLRKRYEVSCKQDGTAPEAARFGTLGDFLLEPAMDDPDADEVQRDRQRLAVFDAVFGNGAARREDGPALTEELRQAIRAAADDINAKFAEHKQAGLRRLAERLRALEPAHRMILVRAAAEWIVARYRRGVENWLRQHDAWEQEKIEWERAHPELTPAVRERFTDVFRRLVWDKDRPPGVKHKRPRICPYERLRLNIDNCCYAGQKGHGPLCWKYTEFVTARKARNSSFNDKKFAEDVARYLPRRAKGEKPHQIVKALFPKRPQAFQQRFTDNWTAYLRAMHLNEETVLQHGRMPHCLKIGETFEQSKCEWNPHTELCQQYRRALAQFDDDTLALEPLYREWRRDYLAGPRKPSFKYPSSRTLPMPKIFGAGFHEIDFDRSVVRLRLDDMPAGQWLEFGFTPWPRDYSPSRKQIKDRVTSVHVHFVGRRARVGFRFDAPHAQARFACSQDEIDELRSRQFPRAAQDRQFLDAARQRLVESFQGDVHRELRILAVDLGETGACAAVYNGRAHETDVPLPIVKINRLYAVLPQALEPDRHGRPEESKRKFDREDPRGLRKEHVARHLTAIAEGAAQIAAHRRQRDADVVTLADHDFRGLKRHVAWMIRDWARHNAAQIIRAAEEQRCDLIVFESLRGFAAPGYDKLGDEAEKKKRRLAMFAYGRIRRKAVEKAVERGMRVVTVPYFRSSQHCSACGREQVNTGLLRKHKKARRFFCEHCKAELGSDANAARVLARVFWGEVILPCRHDSAVQKT